jgi:hypothetical protein
MPEPAQAVTLAGAISTATIAAVVGALGWICAYVLTGWREDRTKRLQLEIDRTSTQIKEFYAPLRALTDHLDATVDVLNAAVVGKTDDEQHRLSGAIYSRMFLPIHKDIDVILKTKAYLSEGVDPPASFRQYFQHYATEMAYWKLRDDGEDVSGMHIPPFPSEFYHDVRSGHATVTERYDRALRELRERRSLLGFLSVNKPEK